MREANSAIHLENVTGAKNLCLSNRKLSTFPQEIMAIKELSYLDISGNAIKSIPENIGDLKNLRVLLLSNNNIEHLPPSLFWMNNLRVLDLGRNKMASLPKEFRHLRNLRKLNLKSNKFKKFPKILSQLSELRELDISNNGIAELPMNLNGLKSIRKLKLSNNRITRLHPEITQLRKLTELNIDGNPMVMPPKEIAAYGKNAIFEYFAAGKAEYDYLYELKLLLVGEGRVGKTSLKKALSQTNFILSDEKSTEGIDITKWSIPASDLKLHKDFNINIWDFGGQEIYHSTHQFFLTRRSLYILVTEPRKEDSYDDFYYWLNIINLLGRRSPTIIVMNKSDQPTKELPINEFRKNFSSIIDYKKVSCMPEYADTIDSLKAEIRRIIKEKKRLKHIGTPLPKTWLAVRSEIEKLSSQGLNYISHQKYLQICTQNNVRHNQASILSQFLHDIGVFSYFKDDIVLKNKVILNHEWLISGVYNVLDNRKIINNKGVFYDDDLVNIWKEHTYAEMHAELLALMKNKKFELCFELEPGKYLAPQLLPVDEAPYEWRIKQGNLRFEYQYTFMPKGILARFIVKMHKEIYKGIFWRHGVLLEYENTRALVQEKYFERKITIILEGDDTKNLLSVIRKAIQEINKALNNPEHFQRVPCNCDDCLNSEKPHFYYFSLLKRYDKNDIFEIRCEISLKMITVRSLLESVSRAGKLEDKQMKEKKSAHIHIDQSVNIHGSVKDSAISAHSDHAKQKVSDSKKINKIFTLMLEAVKNDQTLPKNEFKEIMENIESLRLELEKAQPKPQRAYSFLSNLGSVASISSFMPQLIQYVSSIFK